MTKFSIGCDPEIFLKKKGEGFSAHGVIPGTKKEPHKVDSGMVQVDGMAVEFGIDPVQLDDPSGLTTFNKNIVDVMATMKSMVQEVDKDLRFNISPVQEFDPALIEAQPEEAKELGCDPDFSAYTLEPNPRPDASDVAFRTASGHIHIGWGSDIPVDHPDHMEICANFVKIMDCVVGLYMTILDDDPRRRTLYGKAGAFRPKPYGVEYRTPSNVWLTTKARRTAIFELTKMAVQAMQRGMTAEKLTRMSQEQVRAIIDEGNAKEAYKGLKKLCSTMYWGSHPVTRHVEAEYKARYKRENPETAETDLASKPETVTINNTSYVVKASTANTMNQMEIWNVVEPVLAVAGD